MNIRNAMVPMTVAEAIEFAASFDHDESRGYAEEFTQELRDELTPKSGASDYSVSDFRDPDKFRTGHDVCSKCARQRYLDACKQCDTYSEIHIATNDVVTAKLKSGNGYVHTYERLGYHAYTSEFLRAILDSGCLVWVYRDGSDGVIEFHQLCKEV